MIKRILNQNNFNLFKNKYTFSTLSDPFYILGVDKNAQFDDIKKQFFKLANQYHPDKNKSPEAIKKFLIIKQAFQAIKMQKGLIVPQGFVYDNQGQSMRPNPSQFMQDDEENAQRNTDYKMYAEKAQQGGEKYSKFKGSFQTIHDINDIKVKVQEGDMKDTSQRFSLFKQKGKISFLSQSGFTYLFITGVAAILFLFNAENVSDGFKQNKMIIAQQKKAKIEKNRQEISIESQSIKARKQKLALKTKDDLDYIEYQRMKKKNNRKRQEVITSEKYSV